MISLHFQKNKESKNQTLNRVHENLFIPLILEIVDDIN